MRQKLLDVMLCVSLAGLICLFPRGAVLRMMLVVVVLWCCGVVVEVTMVNVVVMGW